MDRWILVLALLCPYLTGLNAQNCEPNPGRDCEDAPVLCSIGELNGFSCRIPPPPNPSGPIPLCPGGGVPNNIHWWAFVAGANTTTLQITATNCTTVGGQQGIQAGIYTDCTYGTAIFCQPACWQGTQVLSGNTVPCQTYYVFVDGCNGSECDYTIQVLAGANPPRFNGVTELTGPDSIRCAGIPVCYEARSMGSCVGEHIWRIDGDILDYTGDMYCDTFQRIGSVEICAKGIIGNQNTVCSESETWTCITTVFEAPGDTTFLPGDTVCLAVDQEFFITECSTSIRPDTGLQLICCTEYDSMGCPEIICGEYYFSRELESRTVVLCEGESFTAPDGQVLDSCGNYEVVVPPEERTVCDSVADYVVIQPDLEIRLFRQRCERSNCLSLEVFDLCTGTRPDFEVRWIDGEDGTVLAEGVTTFCARDSGTYCVQVSPVFNGKTCSSTDTCITLPQINFMGTGESCDDAIVFCDLAFLDGFSCRNPAPPHPNGPTPLCSAGGVPNNIQWLSFVASSDSVSLRITADNCTSPGGTAGIQAGVYTDCTFQESVACYVSCWVGSQIVNFKTEPCQEYFLFIDGCNGSECDYLIEVLYGTKPNWNTDTTSIIIPDTLVCAGGPVCFEATLSGVCNGEFLWRIDGDTLPYRQYRVCDTLDTEGVVEVCVKYVQKDRFRHCGQSGEWVCRTVEVVEMSVDSIQLDPDTICLEPDQVSFINTCGDTVQVTEGNLRICCESFSNAGCRMVTCGDYLFTRREDTRRDTVILCPDEIFVAANGDTLSRCGDYTVRVPGQGSDKCDQVIDYIVVTPSVRISTAIGHCQDGKSCIWADVMKGCDFGITEYEYRWLDAETNQELSRDTLSFCVDISGEYCLEVTPVVGGKICEPYLECRTVRIPVPAAPPIFGDTILCGRKVFEFSIPLGSYREVEWIADLGELRQMANLRLVELDMTNAVGDSVNLCVRVRNDCGLSSWRCIKLQFVAEPPSADFTFTVVGDSVFFMASERNALSYIWSFGDGSSSTERDPLHRYPLIGNYDVSLIVRNACFSNSKVRRVNIRPTSTGDLQLAADVKVFPNPGEGLFTLRSEDPGMNHGEILLRVTDITGRLVGEHRIDGQALRQGWKLDLTGADAGVYHLLAEGDRAYFVGRLVVTR